jgi:hypothetical protein
VFDVFTLPLYTIALYTAIFSATEHSEGATEHSEGATEHSEGATEHSEGVFNCASV